MKFRLSFNKIVKLYTIFAKFHYNSIIQLNFAQKFLKKYSDKRKKEAQLGKNEGTTQEIAKVFSPDNLKNYIPIAGQEMDNFIILYTPNINTYTASDFNLTVYIDKCYQEFLKIPKEKRQSKQLTELNKSN